MIVITPGGQFGVITEDVVDGEAVTVTYLDASLDGALAAAEGVLNYHHLDSDPEDLVQERHGLYAVSMPAETFPMMLVALAMKGNQVAALQGEGAKVATTLRILSKGLNGMGAESLAVIP